MPTHYELLGVPPDADRDTIWRAYLSAVRAALTGDTPVAQLRALDTAWEVLRDPDRRAEYDRALAEREGPQPSGEGGAPVAPPDVADVAPTGRRAEDEPAAADVVDAERPTPARDRRRRRRRPSTAEPPAEVTGERDTGAETADAAASADVEGADDAEAPAAEDADDAEAPEAEEADETGAPVGAPPVTLPDWEGSGRLRRRRARTLAWLVGCAVVGAVIGLVVYLTGDPPDRFAEGTCVSLDGEQAVPVACDSAQVDGRIAHVAASPEECTLDGGWIEREDGRFACVELLGDPEAES